MNIKVAALTAGRKLVEAGLDRMGESLAASIAEAAVLQERGIRAALSADISPGLIGSVLDYAGRMQADLGHAALMLQGVHASLHEALERLAPNDDANRSGGGGGDDKKPPPKP
jgi:hypothetical protein